MFGFGCIKFVLLYYRLQRSALIVIHKCSSTPRSHVLRGNEVLDALRPVYADVAHDSRRSAPWRHSHAARGNENSGIPARRRCLV